MQKLLCLSKNTTWTHLKAQRLNGFDLHERKIRIELADGKTKTSAAPRRNDERRPRNNRRE